MIWLCREPLRTLITPKNFYGRTGSIVVAHMTNPLQELVEYRKNTIHRDNKNLDWYEANMLGMYVSGELFSSGRGCIGSLATRVWIWPRHLESGGSSHPSFTRIVEKPRKRSEDVEKIILESQQVAEKTLKYAIAHPYLGSFETSNKY